MKRMLWMLAAIAMLCAAAWAQAPRNDKQAEPPKKTTVIKCGAMVDVKAGAIRRGVTIVIVEHIMKVIMTISDRIHAINFGQTIAEGTPKEVADNKAVIEAYLGEDYEG